MKKIFLLALVFAAMAEAEACTNLLVGKKASADGSVMVSYNADSYGMYGFLCHYPAGKHKADEIRDIYDWDTGKYLGHIPEAAETYNVIGNMNEYQVSICETTFEGREELIDTTGVSVMDYGSLIYVALQRSKTAREAIKVMTQLVEKYGYASSGESFSIADKNEIWVMEMIGKGAEKGAVWVAVRIPDDAICAHANQSRIHQFLQYDKKDCMYSKDVISFARKRGYFKGKDKNFSFSAAYAPADFSALRFCEARVWSFFHKYSNDGMMDYLDYAKGCYQSSHAALHRAKLSAFRKGCAGGYARSLREYAPSVDRRYGVRGL
jgi:dipeptidase